jgi:hypothetical protein
MVMARSSPIAIELEFVGGSMPGGVDAVLAVPATRSERVRTTMPASTGREHDGTRVREPSTSTMQTRQAFFGVSVSPRQSTGISTPSLRQASKMVVPSGTFTVRPSMVASTSLRGIGIGTPFMTELQA